MNTPSRSGVFQHATDQRVERFTESVSFDRRLYAYDIAGSIAHAQMLVTVGLLTAEECQQITSTLAEIREEMDHGQFPLRIELEDIHMHIEQALIERLGDVGRKLHTARSRNDQVATDLRLYCRDAVDRLMGCVKTLQAAFVGRCQQDAGVILPAYTHLQRAQPVLAAHYWLAYCEKLERDAGRLQDCRRRMNECSLGCAAVAGTSLPVDRHDVAQRLGFDRVAANSMDVSSDRDFVVELCFSLALLSSHLSGWAEEWILWSTTEFRFIRLPDAFCTGSSIMPQKINPDVLELIRGKTARVYANLHALLVLIKGLPLAYNRDLQEDKPPLFDSIETVQSCLELAAAIVGGMEFQHAAIQSRLEAGYLDATTLMEYLIQRQVPQRTAHHWVGELVATAMQAGVTLSQLSIEQLRALDPTLDEDVYSVLGVENALAAFQSYGSTAPEQVAQQVESWRVKLSLD